MEGKIIVLIAFVTVLQGSLAEYSPTACVKQTGLEMSLQGIEYGKLMSVHGLRGTIRHLYGLMEYEMTQHIYGNHTDAERAFKIETVRNSSYMAIMVGIPPTLHAIKVLQPSLVIETGTDNAWKLLSAFVDIIIAGINLSKLDNYEEALYQLSVLEAQIITLGNSLSNAILGSIIGELTFSAETESLIECTRDQVTANILASFGHFINALEVFLDQIFRGTEHHFEKYLQQIRFHERQSFAHIFAEVIAKYVLAQNIYMSKILEEVGVLNGIFALQAAAPTVGVKLFDTGALQSLQ